MPDILPASRPRLGFRALMELVSPLGLNVAQDKVFVVGVRSYYRDSMGTIGANDRGLYDDAIFLVSEQFFGSYNGNTDPSRRREGHGKANATKGMASLNKGLWRAHQFGEHRGVYLALCQTGGKVTVTRDGSDGDYEDTGHFGINIHSGGWSGTSSLGCQTIPPSQWDGFIISARDQAERHYGSDWRDAVIPYALIDAPG